MKLTNRQFQIGVVSFAVVFAFVVVLAAFFASRNSGNTTTPNNNGLKACTMEAKICPDGSAVGRNPDKNCAFDECPNEIVDPMPIPEEPTNPEVDVCTLELRECPDGSYVGRDPGNKCEFEACPVN